MVMFRRILAKVDKEAPNLKHVEHGNYAVDRSFAQPSLGSPLSGIKLARRCVQNGLQLSLGGLFQRHRFVLLQDPIELAPGPAADVGQGCSIRRRPWLGQLRNLYFAQASARVFLGQEMPSRLTARRLGRGHHSLVVWALPG